MPHLCFLNTGIILNSHFSCVTWLSVCTLDRPIGNKDYASWERGKGTWGGWERGFGTVLEMRFMPAGKGAKAHGEVGRGVWYCSGVGACTGEGWGRGGRFGKKIG
nr:hypothetical protein [Tanacetum cinerariifolium]